MADYQIQLNENQRATLIGALADASEYRFNCDDVDGCRDCVSEQDMCQAHISDNAMALSYDSLRDVVKTAREVDTMGFER